MRQYLTGVFKSAAVVVVKGACTRAVVASLSVVRIAQLHFLIESAIKIPIPPQSHRMLWGCIKKVDYDHTHAGFKHRLLRLILKNFSKT